MSASTTSSHKLTKDDLKTVLEELADGVSSKWYLIGVLLNVSTDKLDSLKQQNGTDCTALLCTVLLTWIKTGKATWEALTEALRSDTVEEMALAEQLRTGYCMQDLVEGDTQDITDTGTTNNLDLPEVNGEQPKSTNAKKLLRKVPQRFHNIDFVQNQKADRFCIKCKQVPYTAQRSSCCGSLYCGVCQPRVTKSCFKCKEQPSSFEKDTGLTSKISKVKIRCPNRTKGCKWKGEVYKLKTHLPECSPKKEGKELKKEATKSAKPRKKIDKGESSAMQGKDEALSAGQKPRAKKKGKIGATSWSPPLNLVMKDVLSFKSSGEFWLSDSFYSHPLGYKLSLAVKVEEGSGDRNIKITLALVSSEGKQSRYLDFPCFGIANVFILNPETNADHELLETLFMVENKDSQVYPELNEQTEIPLEFVHKDCLFFRVDKVDLKTSVYKLWLLDPQFYKQQK